ncbi:histidine phosphatase family protein [Paenibacillus agilis]|uniref:Histidine phosphatase family protein n=1 Tax=Paenibacillus agilis TaxID=3020863 RepID=A0A559IW71_9BACL|nr:histidine phosphatase family protein [Paenibacillus agilis]TVX91863.1 histidine phosphatase family protein [Paenibacillus agilis]
MENHITTVYIVRHGQTEWNVEHRLQGHQDSPLTEFGVRQAEWLGESMANEAIDRVYSSSSGRAHRTAEIIRGSRSIDIIDTDDFKEIGLGSWEGISQTEAKERFPEQFDHFWKDPAQFQVDNSETFQQVSDRAVRKLNEIVSEHRGKSIVIVTHTVVVKVLMAYFEGRAMNKLWDLPYIHPACLCKVQFVGDEPSILLHGDISHYKEDPVPS